jgi:hypothetical protein
MQHENQKLPQLETMQSLTNDLRNDTLSATKHIDFSTHKRMEQSRAKKLETPSKGDKNRSRRPTLKVCSELERHKQYNKVSKFSMETDPKKIEEVMRMLKTLAL